MTFETTDPKAPYYEALGRFVDMFAHVESAMAFTLWHYAKTPRNIARAVFSGVRVDAAIDLINRLIITAVTDVSEDLQKELNYVFPQLKIINTARNDIYHYGVSGIADGTLGVTTRLKALTEDRVRTFPVSSSILNDMSADLDKIILHLYTGHMGLHPLLPTARLAILQDPWRHKPQPQQK
jgi:hypothetical protein